MNDFATHPDSMKSERLRTVSRRLHGDATGHLVCAAGIALAHLHHRQSRGALR